MKNKFKVKTPIGYLMVERKGVEDDYPGIFISFSKDGTEYDVNQIIACIEYDSGRDECIKIVSYTGGREDPTHIIRYDNGKEIY